MSPGPLPRRYINNHQPLCSSCFPVTHPVALDVLYSVLIPVFYPLVSVASKNAAKLNKDPQFFNLNIHLYNSCRAFTPNQNVHCWNQTASIKEWEVILHWFPCVTVWVGFIIKAYTWKELYSMLHVCSLRTQENNGRQGKYYSTVHLSTYKSV